MDNEGTTLRESIEQAFDKVESGEIAKDAPPLETPQLEAKAEPVKDEAPKEGRTAGRARDEQGRLLPGKADKPEPKAQTPAAAEPPAKPRPNYPSTWKKDFQPHWEKLPQEVVEEITRREGDYAKGVSTYKGEYDRVKPVDEVLKQYQPFFQQSGYKPEQVVQSLMQADQTLRYGQPADKLRLFTKLATDYQIPVHEMFVQGEDGKLYFNQQHSQQPQQTAQSLTPETVEQIIQKKLNDQYWATQIQNFTAATDDAGNPKHPHFDTVRQTMDGILRAGLAKDLPSAYDAALRMPQHADLFEALQQQQAQSRQDAEAKAKAEAAARAKRNTVSVKTQSPTGSVAADKGRKDIRSSIEAAFEQVESGRL